MFSPIRPISITMLAAAVFLMALVASPGTAQAEQPTSAVAGYTLYAAKWQQPTVEVWPNWDEAVCDSAYPNVTGNPAPPLSAREMQGILTAVIAELNQKLRGGLTLVDGGTGPGGAHCGQDGASGGISIGWSPLATGIAGIAPLTFDNNAIVGAGVVINPILVCGDVRQWIELVVLHEMLHALGIAHSDVPGSVMNERAGCDASADLSADDIAALRDQYPAGIGARPSSDAATIGDHERGHVYFEVTDTELTPEQLIPRLAATGCEPRVFAVTTGGRMYLYLVGAPSFVNAAFPPSLAAMTPFVYRCAG